MVPRATQLAGGIGLVYTALTALWAMMLNFSGMNVFDAVTHSMTTLATGGYSTRTDRLVRLTLWLLNGS